MSLHKRVATLEAQRHRPGQQVAISAATERFEAKFTDLIARQAGRPAGPGDSVATHIAAQFWHDPAGAVERIRALARARMAELEHDPQYRRWRDGRSLSKRVTALEGHTTPLQRPIVIVPIDQETGAILGPGVAVAPVSRGPIDYRLAIAALAPSEQPLYTKKENDDGPHQ